MSADLERKPGRLDSQKTHVEDDFDEAEQKNTRWSNEKPPKFSNDRSSLHDNPYNLAARHISISRIPNLKGASPLPGSQIDGDQFGEVPWHCGDPHRYATLKKGDAWQKCHQLTEKYDNEMCDAWKEEVDKLLIFAGLFSATVTAFTIESYKWLDEGPDDVSLRLLAFLATQTANSSNPLPSSLKVPPFAVQTSDVRINAAWFLSLTFGLTTVLVGILCLQWLREFQRDAALPHKEAVALRQMRYEGLLHWRVPEILSALPVLLQLSLILFFVGLLDLLWTRNKIVAALVSAAVGMVMVFLGATTALPALQHALSRDKHLRVHQCPYKSPQSWLCYRLGHTIFQLGHTILWIFTSLVNLPWSNFDSPRFHRLLRSAGDLNWMTFDMRWRHLRDAEDVIRGSAKMPKDSDDIIRGLQWINDTFSQSVEAIYPVYHGLQDLEVSAAAATISHFYLDIGQIDNDTLRVMLDDRFSPTEDQKRDIIAAYYLHLHQETHSTLKTSYVETVIRILNSQEVPQPFYDWLSEILQELATTTLSHDLASSASLLNPEISIQVLLCVKSLMARNALRTLDMVVAWALLNRLLSPTILASSSDPNHDAQFNVHHLKLACGMFEEFERWIKLGKEIERWERIKLCAEGMMTVFPPYADLGWLKALCSEEMERGVAFVRALDGQVEEVGGAGALLKRGRWWLDYWEVFTERDWRRLVEDFGAVGVGG